MAKYKNYNELSEAFKSGELTEHHRLQLDKGGTHTVLYYEDPNASNGENRRMSKQCEKLWAAKYRPIESLFEALGIPAENC